jgi:hypothetical protein
MKASMSGSAMSSRRNREVPTRQAWTDFGDRNIVVSHGSAHFWGLVGSETERRVVTPLAEGVSDETIPTC